MNYLQIIKNVLQNGVSKQPTRVDANGNNIEVSNGTIGTSSEIFRHDMSEGFPLTGLRKMPWKSIRIELQGFIQGICDKKWYQDQGCNFWNEWCSPVDMPDLTPDQKKCWQFNNRDLGPLGYAAGWRNFGGFYRPVPNSVTCFDKTIEVLNTKHKMCGQVIENGPYKYTVIYYDQTNKKFAIKFHHTGFVIELVTKSKLHKMVDPYHPTVCSIGCEGLPKNLGLSTSIINKLKTLWCDLISICYDTNHPKYKSYGAKGVYVSNKWLTFWDFAEDVTKLNSWSNKLESWNYYDLDYRLNGGNCFSPTNSIWLSNSEIRDYKLANCYFQAEKVDSCGTYEYTHLGIRNFCSIHRLNVNDVEKAIDDQTELKVGDATWNFFDISASTTKTGVDQFKDILRKLKESPYDRRMICMAWDPTSIHKMALPPCHYGWTVVVYGNKINLTWKQRSCDLMLGVGANIASYALLLLLLAKHSGFEPGELVGVLEDCHIYQNHIEAAKKLAERSEPPLPTVDITSQNFDILNWQWHEVQLNNYCPHPSVEVGAVTV